MPHAFGRLVAGLILAFVLVTAPAGAATVTVRIEGNTVAGTTTVNTTGAGVPGNAACKPHSAGEALELATAGNWDRQMYVETIHGESHTYAESDYWAFWVNGSYSTVGLCDYIVQPGDELLFYPQVDGPGFQGTVWPLYLTGVPAAVTAGQPYTVTVIERVSDGASTTSAPAVGATVSDGSTTAVTGPDGRATLIAPSGPGTIRLVATQASRVNSPRPQVAVVAPAPAPAPEGPAPDPAPVVPSPVESPAAVDTTPPVATISGLRNRQRFSRRRAPRELRGTVADEGAIASVELRLHRRHGRRCAAYDGATERFRRISCRREARWFRVGSSASWSYLLPRRLPSGLYQLQVRATDAAGNRSAIHSLRFRVR